MAAMAFSEKLKSNSFIVTAEFGSVKGTDTTQLIESIAPLQNKVDALNATDNKYSVMRYSSIGSSILIKELGGEPILNVTCRDRNRIAIQSDLLFAWSRGVSSILCLTGDPIEYGDDNQAKGVFDLDCSGLVELIHNLNSGKDMAGHELEGGTRFCIGVTSYCVNRLEQKERALQKKVEAGVDFIQTGPIYDIEDLKGLVNTIRRHSEKVKIIAGIMPLASLAMGQYINSNLSGITVPDRVLEEMNKAERGKKFVTGMEIAARLIKQIKEEQVCDGVHIVYQGHVDRILDLIDMAGLLKVSS